MGSNDGQILAFLHFALTELRPLWLLWYTVFNTFESVVTGASFTDAFEWGGVTGCLKDKKITVRDVENCAKSAYRKYLASGPQAKDMYEECTSNCPGSRVGVELPEPRIMVFFMTVWLFGFALVLLVYCIYSRPDYNNGSYIKFTQSLYSSKPYRIVANCTFLVSILVILIGIYVLIKNNKGSTTYVLALILMVMASRSLVHLKHDGFDITSEKFCELQISHGNSVMRVVNLLLITNATLLDEMEVQVVKKVLPRVAASDEEGCGAGFAWGPLSDTSIEALLESEDMDGNRVIELQPTV